MCEGVGEGEVHTCVSLRRSVHSCGVLSGKKPLGPLNVDSVEGVFPFFDLRSFFECGSWFKGFAVSLK